MLRESLEHHGRSPLAREGSKTQDKAKRLMLATAHVFEDMTADCHPLSIAGGILPFPWAFGQFWRKYGVDRTGVSSAVSSRLSAMLKHPGILSCFVPSHSSSSG